MYDVYVVRNDSMRHLLALLTVGVIAAVPVSASESDLLDAVKRNPQEAKALCKKFRKLNTKGGSAYDAKTTRRLASNKSLSIPDAEVLVTYVVGMHCPNVR